MELLHGKNYQRISQYEDAEETRGGERMAAVEGCDPSIEKAFAQKRTARGVWNSFISPLLIICLTMSNLYSWRIYLEPPPISSVFSPASSAIRYQNVVFQAGINSDTSPYQGPLGGESDSLWEELHKYGVSKIPRRDAAQLANRTSPISGDEGNYVVILEVFHLLHCLSHMRRRIFWNETTMGSPDDVPALAMKHMDHCIDSIRQSLMCAADITPLPYVWWRKYNQLMPASAVTHTCRDFDAIRNWAKERVAGKIDDHVQVHDPLGSAVVYDV